MDKKDKGQSVDSAWLCHCGERDREGERERGERKRKREGERENIQILPLSTASLSLDSIHWCTEAKRREVIEKLAPSIGSKMKGARFASVSRARPQIAGIEQLQLRYRNLWCVRAYVCTMIRACISKQGSTKLHL